MNPAQDFAQKAGELACLAHMAHGLAVGSDEGDRGDAWKLRCLLGAMRHSANALHDMAEAAMLAAHQADTTTTQKGA
jgi:hypothetical protein